MGNWKKYFIEVIVIMFGILGAFWLEQWNEDRIEENDTLILLESLKDNLLEDRKGLDTVSNQRIQMLNDGLAKLDSVNITDSLRIKDIVKLGFWITTPSTYEITFQEMLNTGKFYKINEPELKNNIALYYKRFRVAILNIDEYNKEVWNLKFNPLASDRLILKYEIDRKNLNNINFKWLNDSTDERFKWFKFQILNNINLTKYQLSYNKDLLKINNELVKSIESYLQEN